MGNSGLFFKKYLFGRIKKVLQMRVITVIIISLPSHTEFTVITKCRTVCYVITLSHCITDHIYFVIR